MQKMPGGKFVFQCIVTVAVLLGSAAADDDSRPSSPVPAIAEAKPPVLAAPASTAEPLAVALSPAPSAIILRRAQQHKFFDVKNSIPLGLAAVALTADALSTQKGLGRPGFHEINPVAKPFVQTRGGAAVYTAGSFGALAGLMYLAHKKNHHKLERFLPVVTAGWEGFLSFRNYHVIETHR